MKTDELIDMLGTNIEPVRDGQLRNTLLIALAMGTAQGSAHKPDGDRCGYRTGCGGAKRGGLCVSSSWRLHPVYRTLVWWTHHPLCPRRGDARTTASTMVIHPSWLKVAHSFPQQ